LEKYFFVFIGGGIGSAARYWLSGLVQRTTASLFPYGTLSVNIIGCFLIGLFMSTFEERFLLNPTLRVFLTIGILGGFTTFSTFSYDTISLLRDAEYFHAIGNVAVSLISCLSATYAGMVIGKLF
jgi:fluoride exporter